MAISDHTTEQIEAGYKRCCTCKQIKTYDQFHSNASTQDKLSYQCKPCKLDANKRYFSSEKGREARHKAVNKYMQTPAGKGVKAQSAKRMTELYPEKQKARDMVAHAIRDGKLPRVKTLLCADCGDTAKEYHHPDYSKPMLVIPLCGKCHHRRHHE